MGLFSKTPGTGELLARLDKLEREHKAMRLEWEELADKVYRWMQRTRKRDRDEAAAGAVDTGEPLHPAVARIMQRRGARGLSATVRNGGDG